MGTISNMTNDGHTMSMRGQSFYGNDPGDGDGGTSNTTLYITAVSFNYPNANNLSSRATTCYLYSTLNRAAGNTTNLMDTSNSGTYQDLDVFGTGTNKRSRTWYFSGNVPFPANATYYIELNGANPPICYNSTKPYASGQVIDSTYTLRNYSAQFQVVCASRSGTQVLRLLKKAKKPAKAKPRRAAAKKATGKKPKKAARKAKK